MSLGGDVAVGAVQDSPGHPWQVAVAEAPGDDPAQLVVLDSGGMATSTTTHRRWRSARAASRPPPARPAHRAPGRAQLADGVRGGGELRRGQHRQHRLARPGRRARPPGSAGARAARASRRGRRAVTVVGGWPEEEEHEPTRCTAPALVPQPRHGGRARRRPHALDRARACCRRPAAGRGWPRFALQCLHRNVSLLACALLVAHAVTPVLDTYVNHYAPIGLVDAVVPFVSAYKPLALGLGTLALDLMVVVVLTSVVRRRFGHRTWFGLHLLPTWLGRWASSTASSSGTDAWTTWGLGVTVGAVLTVTAAWSPVPGASAAEPGAACRGCAHRPSHARRADRLPGAPDRPPGAPAHSHRSSRAPAEPDLRTRLSGRGRASRRTVRPGPEPWRPPGSRAAGRPCERPSSPCPPRRPARSPPSSDRGCSPGSPPGPGLREHRHPLAGAAPPRQAAADGLLDAVPCTGRGGAGFPFARKVRAARRAPGKRRTVVVNASEGEPASAKDSSLLVAAPHLVLDGAEAVAQALGADAVHVVVGHDRRAARLALDVALAERDADRSEHCRRVEVHVPARRSSAARSGAVIELLEGRENLPVTVLGAAAVTGLRGRPTLLSNAETFAQVAALLALGPAGYAELGTPAEPGTTLLTVAGDGPHGVVLEVPFGVGLGSVLEYCGYAGDAPVLLGGYHGTWVPPGYAPHLPVSRHELAAAGLTLGAGVVLPLDLGTCPSVSRPG